MNIVLECEVILSKKLEAICEQGEPISISISSVSGNKARAIMRLVCKDNIKDIDVGAIGETSIQFKIISASEDAKSMDDSLRFSNIISSNGEGLPAGAEKLVAKTSPDIPEGEPYVSPATPSATPSTNPLEAIAGNPDAIKALASILAAAGLSLTKQDGGQIVASKVPSAKLPTVSPKPAQIKEKSIQSYEELTSEIAAIPGIDKEISLPADRKLTRGEADQLFSRMPKLKKKVFIKNALQSQLLIGDFYTSLDGGGPCLSLLPGQAFDLTRVPAKNIMNSNDFRWCVETGKVIFVDAGEYAASFKRVNEEAARWGKGELPVYGGEVSRLSPSDSPGGTAEILAAGAMDTDGTIATNSSESVITPINIESSGQDVPPSVPYEESPEMQSIINQMPSGRASQHQGPKRI